MLAQTSPEMPEGVLSAERLAEKHTEDEMNGQWSLFEGSQPLKIDKPIRLIELFAASIILLSAMTLLGVKDREQTQEIEVCTREEWEAAHPQKSAETEYMEDPLETEHINETLFATGYLREDVPLSIGDQLALRASSDWYGVPYSLCLAVIEGECNFNADNDDGRCYGLFALNRNYFPDDLESWENTQYGVECLAGKLEEYNDDVPAALTAYNAGEDNGNRDYAEFVMAFSDKWNAMGVDEYKEAS